MSWSSTQLWESLLLNFELQQYRSLDIRGKRWSPLMIQWHLEFCPAPIFLPLFVTRIFRCLPMHSAITDLIEEMVQYSCSSYLEPESQESLFKFFYNLWRYKVIISDIYIYQVLGKCVAQTLCHGSELWLLSLWLLLLTGVIWSEELCQPQSQVNFLLYFL